MSRTGYLVAASVLCSLLLPARSQAQDCTSNLLIVLDRSCSMTSNSIMGKTRWDIAVAAINKLTANNSGKIRFGLATFPNKTTTTPKCVQTSPLLAPALDRKLDMEILTNTIRHARAETLWLRFAREADGSLTLRSRDDGIGVDAVAAGNGLSGMRERIKEFGGSLDIDTAPGRGFALAATLPMETQP